jgi:hypothetical protein
MEQVEIELERVGEQVAQRVRAISQDQLVTEVRSGTEFAQALTAVWPHLIPKDVAFSNAFYGCWQVLHEFRNRGSRNLETLDLWRTCQAGFVGSERLPPFQQRLYECYKARLADSAVPAQGANLGDWKLDLTDDGAKATNDSLGIEVSLIMDGGGVELLEWKPAPENDQVMLLIYHSGIAGTTTPYEITRAIIVHVGKKSILGQGIYKVEPHGHDKKTAQPRWIWSRTGLKITQSLEADQVISF